MKTVWLAKLILKLVPPTRDPDFIVGPSKDDPYLRRWWLIPRNRFFNVYLHHVLRDDDDRALHDHPWPSLSLNLTGGLAEFYCRAPRQDLPPIAGHNMHYRTFRQGQWVWRGLGFAHRLVVVRQTVPETDPGVWTLFITGPVMRKWGFWCPHSWRYWQDFVDTRDTGRIGRGCE
jgi:hypothetical protein